MYTLMFCRVSVQELDLLSFYRRLYSNFIFLGETFMILCCNVEKWNIRSVFPV